MNLMEKGKLIAHILRWRLNWSRRKLDFCPKGKISDRFVSARVAAAKIPDGATVFSSGIAGNARCSIFFYALRDRFLKSGHPKDLFWINGGAQGSRGRVPGTIEELGLPGLMKTYLTAHLETAKAQLKLGSEGLLELHTLPQGIIAQLLAGQGSGQHHLHSRVGWHSFLDPATGRGSLVNPPGEYSFVRHENDGLRYNMPKVTVALFNVPYADPEGNLYFKNASTISENLESVAAARHNGGIVMAAVSQVIAKSTEEISVPAEQVDYIVVNPFNEQTITVPQRRYWELFTPYFRDSRRKAVRKLKFINDFLKITPVRDEIAQMMGQLAASLFEQVVPEGSMVNVGVGFGEEVARILVDRRIDGKYRFTTEAGAYGGLPAPGIFFGAAVHPDHLEASSRMFGRYEHDLEAAILGFLEFDTQGNVNVSKRGPNILDYVGPGGFPNIVYGARTLIFIGRWMQKAKMEVREGQVHVQEKGVPKFVDQVAEITFNGREALNAGKKIFFVTDVGLFKLTEKGMALLAVFPGIDLQRDILGIAGGGLVLPPGEDEPLILPPFSSAKVDLPL